MQEIGWVDIREGTHENDKGYIDRRYNNYLPLKPKNTPNTAYLQIGVDLTFILENGFNTWLENAPTETDPLTQIIILNIDGTAKQITLEEMKLIIIKKGSIDNSGAFFKGVSSIKEENKPESKPIQQTSVNGALSRVCGECGKFHLASCYFPNGNFQTLPADWYAGECRGFIPKQPVETPDFEDKAEPSTETEVS